MGAFATELTRGSPKEVDMERSDTSSNFSIGSSMPKFSLPNVDDRTVTQEYFSGAKAALVVFSCNHCPYVIGSEEMLITIVRRFEGDGLRTVAISSNDAAKYPEDGFEQMKAKSLRMSLPYPYLYDQSQSVARAFDAACTPECYLFDATGKLVYHGTINDNPKDPSKARMDYLTPAISSVLEGQRPNPTFRHPIGCSIKWK